MSTRVVVADDQAVIREGLMTLLGLMPGMEVVGGAADGAEAVALVAELAPDAVLMDLSMPRMDGVTATARITAEHPDVAVVVLTTTADDRQVLDALQAGARAFLTKDANKTEIVRAIEAAVARHTTLGPEVQRLLLAAAVRGSARGPQPPRPEPAPGEPALTPREVDVLGLMAKGFANAAIARRLIVGESTVKTHVNHLFAKLGVSTRAEAVAWAHEHGYGGRD
ncbi:response regulator [Streptomyces sp. NPDC058683]|uniref:response regulator n=1 Tax=Streptomyces sp. NPDC058683 TaxID=3346597 RepID=UPI00364FC087